jgi:hypothetical protein
MKEEQLSSCSLIVLQFPQLIFVSFFITGELTSNYFLASPSSLSPILGESLEVGSTIVPFLA